METIEKNWAQEYILDPLTAPQPSEESGPGTSFLLDGASYAVRPNAAPPQRRPSNRLTKAGPPARRPVNTGAADVQRSFSAATAPPPSYSTSIRSAASVRSTARSTSGSIAKDPRHIGDAAREIRDRPTKAYPTFPPPSAFPLAPSVASAATTSAPTTARRSRQATFPPSSGASAHHGSSGSGSSSSHNNKGHPPSHQRHRRTSSLNEKYPGDMSHRPLDTLRKEKYIADRSRHATRKHHIQPDKIDSLDEAGIAAYHHSGPYDPTLFARNNCANSPLAALADSNAEALRATPRDKIVDSVRGHRPLDGVAIYAPGETDPNGQTYTYEPGDNMMTAPGAGGGAYKRWPGVEYHPDDFKGKGEPSYSIERAMKEMALQQKQQQGRYRDEEGVELASRGGGQHQHHHHHLLPLLPGHRHRSHSDGRQRSQGGGGGGQLDRPKAADGGPTITTTPLDGDDDAAAAAAAAGGQPQRSGSLKAFRKRLGSLQKRGH